MKAPEWLARPGAWFWAALALGAGLRLALLLGTPGTFDVDIKLHHGKNIIHLGLIEWYRQAEVMNHPPLMGELFAGLVRAAVATGVRFAVWLRAPFALLDLATAGMLLVAFARSPWRYLVCVVYWLSPLAVIFSAYHGNTDTALACAALASLLLVARRHPLGAGALLGVGLWVKLPILLAAPVLCLGFPDVRDRMRFTAAAVLVGVAGYLPAVAHEPALLLSRIAGYAGSPVETPQGVAVWGIVHTLRIEDTAVARALASANAWVCLAPVLLLAWLRRGRADARALGVGIAACHLVVYGLTSSWAWQYLAWSLPFLLFLDVRLAAALMLVLGAYVYGAYAFYTGSPWLVGSWNFATHGPWPAWLLLLRDASVLLCLGAATALLGAEIRRALRARAEVA